jgi:2-hydroxy-3-keto-5-methylthiopentenyl-1-phosphate phosphatase
MAGDVRPHLEAHVEPVAEGRAPVSFLVDYDGTISLVDIGDELVTRHYPDQAELARKDALYEAGQMGSRELIAWDMEVLPRDPELMLREAAAMPQDRAFPGFVAAVRARGAQVEVVSDGLGFYVRSNLAALGPTDVAVATNENRLAGGEGMSFPYGHPTCFVCGTCKRERVRLHQGASRVAVFIGDGTSDRYAAAHADVVFATGNLARICEAEGWPYVSWRNFEDVTAQVERAFSDGRLPGSPDELPEWRVHWGRPPGPFICGPEVWGPGRTTPGRKAPGHPPQAESVPEPEPDPMSADA